jgi:hypothetical protein
MYSPYMVQQRLFLLANTSANAVEFIELGNVVSFFNNYFDVSGHDQTKQLSEQSKCY